MHEVYEAQEDSYLLIECLPKELSGKNVLELGSGSGIVSVAAATVGGKVTALDINPAAVLATKKLAKEKNVQIEVLESDKFSAVQGKTFDYILCNPPYLPNEEKDPDIALDGGIEGWEYIADFLAKAGTYLSDNGKIILLFSSHSKIDKVAEHIHKNNFIAKILASKHVGFFEELHVVELEKEKKKWKSRIKNS